MTIFAPLTSDVTVEIFRDVSTKEIGILHLEAQCRAGASRGDQKHLQCNPCNSHERCCAFPRRQRLDQLEEDELISMNRNELGHSQTARKRHAPSSLTGLIM